MSSKKENVFSIIALIIATATITYVISNFIFVNMLNSMVGFEKMDFKDYMFGRSSNSTKPQMNQEQKIDEVKKILMKKYYKPVNEENLVEGALKGMADSLKDPYTVYMPKSDFESFSAETIGTYYGIGIYVGVDEKDNKIQVISPIEGSPAQAAGILAGDKIVKVNDVAVKGNELDKAVTMMKGPRGSTVKITLERKNEKNLIEKQVTREEIKLQTVKSKVIDKIGYIRITNFDENTYDDFNKQYKKLNDEKIKGLIIDLRNNPGGIYDQVVKITDRLIPKGTIVYTEDRNKVKKIESSDPEEIKIPLVVLVNEGSASASEILAGAVKDTKKGVLVGTKTFGKGVVQELAELKDGSAVKVTVSSYFTPSGVCIQGIGIKPDVEVKLDKPLETLSEQDDIQLKKALEIIKDKNK